MPGNDKVNNKYVAWYYPSQTTNMYGALFSVFPAGNDTVFPHVYGAEFNISPLAPFLLLNVVVYLFMPDAYSINLHDSIISSEEYKKIYGLQIGLLNFDPSIIYGLDINAVCTMRDSQVNGLTVAGLLNSHENVNGVTIAPLGNNDARCRGLQIGLFNTAADLRGFQIGLWNKNKKRSLPLINWCF
jgi:hypothetical protein